MIVFNRKIESILLVFIILVPSLCIPALIYGQETSPPADSKSHTREDMLPIPAPPLEHLEKAVSDQLRERKKQFDAIIQDPAISRTKQARAYGDLGLLYHAYELFETAEACYRNALKLDPDSYTWNYSLGYLLQKNGGFTEAASYYQKALDVHQDLGQEYLVNIRLGECLLGANEPDRAARAFERAWQINPEDPAALARLGETAFKEKRYEDAVAYLEKALEKQPAADKLHYTLAMAYRGLRKMKKAREHLAKRGKVGVQPPDPLVRSLNDFVTGSRVHILNARMAFGAGRFEEAADLFQKAVEAEPENVGARVNLGVSLSRLKKHDEAMIQFQEALLLDPDDLTANFNIGSLHLFLGEYKKAVKHLQFAVQTDPKDSMANLLLANALMKNLRITEAVEYYDRALKIDNELTDAWLELSSLLSMIDQPVEALRILEAAHLKKPKDGPITHALARELASTPDLSKRDGRRALELALKVFRVQKDHETARTLAIAYAELNLCDKAIFWMERSIELAGRTGEDISVLRVLFRNLEHFHADRPCRVP